VLGVVVDGRVLGCLGIAVLDVVVCAEIVG
jgi:hypothetical protein